MLIFLDTEYTDSLNCDLISVGMVSEDGNYEFYSERSDFAKEWCNSFVRTAVLPLLGNMSPAISRNQLQEQLASWFALLPGDIIVACDSFTDWELLIDALGEVRPGNLIGRFDLREYMSSMEFHLAVVTYHEHIGPWHHALHDAHAHRQGWLACNSRSKEGKE